MIVNAAQARCKSFKQGGINVKEGLGDVIASQWSVMCLLKCDVVNTVSDECCGRLSSLYLIVYTLLQTSLIYTVKFVDVSLFCRNLNN